MEFFRIKKDIPFMRHALVFNVISALTFVAAVFFLLHKGLHLSVEFTGGTVMELRYQQAANLERIRGTLEKIGYEQPEATSFGTAHDVMLRLPVVKNVSPKDASAQVFDALCKAESGSLKDIDTVTAKGEHVVKQSCADAAGAEAVSLQKVEFVGPQVGDELTENGLKALAAKHKQIQDVRGLGAMVAIELFKDGDLAKPDADLTKRLCVEAAKRGLILLSCGSYANVVRVLVPLTASDALIDEGLQIMADCFKALA